MKVRKLSSVYESPLRAEQKQATRQRILDAAGRLMQDRELGESSFAAIAAEAGVKERTVYRHFPNKSALIEALCVWYAQRVHYDVPQTESELLTVPQRVFPGFAANERFSRALWSSPQGRAFRLRNVEERKRGIKMATADALRSLPPREAKWIAAVAHVLITSATWQTMKDYWGLSADEAGRASSMAIELLLKAARANGTAAAKRNRK
jgi:AcrR family transcriptional regulator